MLSVMLTGKSFQYRYYISLSYSERRFHFICTSLLAYMQILWQSSAADGIGWLVMRVGWLATCSGLWENLLDRSGCPWYIVHLSQCLIHQPGFNLPRQQWSLLNHFRTEQRYCSACRRKWRLTDTDLLICVLVARSIRCPTLSNPVPWQNWMAAYLGYTLWMKTLFRGWQVMVHDMHMRRRRSASLCCQRLETTWIGILNFILAVVTAVLLFL